MSIPRLVCRLIVAFLRSLAGPREVIEMALRRSSRHRSLYLLRTLYAALLLTSVALISATVKSASALPHYGSYLFTLQAVLQIGIAILVPPALMAQVIATERGKGTATLLLLAARNPAAVVRGLISSKLLLFLAVFLGGAPVASMAALLGGVSLSSILLLTLGSIFLAYLGASLGALLGADLPVRSAPFVALVATIFLAWLLTYPTAILAVAVAALQESGLPLWLTLILVSGLLLPFALLFVWLITREAGKALLRNLTPVARKKRRLRAVRRVRHDALDRILSPALLRFRVPAWLLLLPPLIGLLAAPLDVSSALGILVRVAAGYVMGVALILSFLFCSIYPAYRVARLRSDPMLILLALTPVDLVGLFRKTQRRIVAVVIFGITISSGLSIPLLVSGPGFGGLPMAVLLLTALLAALTAVSFYIGSRASSPARAVTTMLVAWVISFVLLPVAGSLGVISFYPLAAPFAAVAGSGQPGYYLPTLALLPIGLLLGRATARRLRRALREPYEAMARGDLAFG